MTFEKWWPKPKVPMPIWFEGLRARFRACWIQATDEATRAERKRCQAEVSGCDDKIGELGVEIIRLSKHVARLREALRLIYIRADVQADEPIYELAETALSDTAEQEEE